MADTTTQAADGVFRAVEGFVERRLAPLEDRAALLENRVHELGARQAAPVAIEPQAPPTPYSWRFEIVRDPQTDLISEAIAQPITP